MTDRPNLCATCGGGHSPRRAFCGECLEPRHVGGGAHVRMVKCANCGTKTKHYVFGEKNPNDAYDYGVPAFWHPDAPWTHVPPSPGMF
jgi:hypothetical protein